MSTYTTRKQQFPGSAVLTAEFEAIATDEQKAIVTRTFGTWGDIDAARGTWGWLSLSGPDSGTDVLIFHRPCAALPQGAVEVSA
jgi:hypothetical protein